MNMVTSLVALTLGKCRKGVSRESWPTTFPFSTWNTRKHAERPKWVKFLPRPKQRRSSSLGPPDLIVPTATALPSPPASSATPATPFFLHSMHVAALTLRALARPCSPKRDCPAVLTIGTLECTHFDGTSFDTERLALHKGLCEFLPARILRFGRQSPARYVHPPGRLLLIQTLPNRQVEEPRIHPAERNFRRTVRRSKASATGHPAHSSAATGSGHIRIMGVCS